MSKNRPHDRRGLYRKNELPRHARLVAAEIEDPYAAPAYVNEDGTADAGARLASFQHRDGTVAKGAPGWTPPPRPTITVIRSLKDDPLGHMYARRQIDEAAFWAGRSYQFCYGQAQRGGAGHNGLELLAACSGGVLDPLTENRQRAIKRLQMIDQALARRHGQEGVMLVRDVLTENLSIERAAARRGASGDRSIRSWGWLFRRCLDVIAYKLGFASAPVRPKR